MVTVRTVFCTIAVGVVYLAMASGHVVVGVSVGVGYLIYDLGLRGRPARRKTTRP